ncbi:MAG: PqiC family protein [Gammaproteobacteria bacterium]|nr:PqiC family protein [Gammaproteobacteria bacterium]
MHQLNLRSALAVSAICLMVIQGCARTPPTNFYLLTPVPENEPDRTAAQQGLDISVGPVELPGYLDRPQIVTRTGENALQLAEFDRWAEPLQGHFARILAENVSILLPTDRVTSFPDVAGTPIDFRIPVQVTQFERDAEGRAVLTVYWQIFKGNGNDVLLTRNSSFSAQANGQGYEGTVAAMNEALTAFSREVVEAIKAFSQSTSP